MVLPGVGFEEESETESDDRTSRNSGSLNTDQIRFEVTLEEREGEEDFEGPPRI